MKTAITKIGNSKGLIIPVQILKQCGFENEVSLEVKDNSLVISNIGKPRSGWAEAFEKAGVDQIMMDNFGNSFDKDEWTW